MKITKFVRENIENKELKTFLLQKPEYPLWYPILKVKSKVELLLITYKPNNVWFK